jgi:signal transduction histidine kinase
MDCLYCDWNLMGSMSNMNDLMPIFLAKLAQTLEMSTDQLQNELRDEGGAGLGLSITKGYVEVHVGISK